jgi:hypothetical protein
MSLIIIDFEASSLLPGSFPIEVGWVHEDGSGESHLIRPADSWLDPARGNPGWSQESEAVHGISLAELQEHGEPADVVARRAEAVLCRPDVLPCSDAPPCDGYWLDRLFDAGGVRRQVKLTDIHSVYDWACRGLAVLLPPVDAPERRAAERRMQDIALDIIGDAEVAESERLSVRHRALEDAQSLWRTRQAILAAVQQRLQEAGL